MDIPTIQEALLHADGLTTAPTGLGGLGLSGGGRPRRRRPGGRGGGGGAAAASLTGVEVVGALGRAYAMAPGDGDAAAGALLASGALVPADVGGVAPGVGGEGATRLVDAVRYVLVYARDGRTGGLNVLLDATAALLPGGGRSGTDRRVASGRVPRTLLPLAVRPAAEFVSSFNDTFGAICANVLLRGGREVQYARIRSDPSWRVYLAHVAEAAHVTDWADLSPSTRLAFLLNIYNGLVMHAKLVFGHASTLASRGTFFNTSAYVLGGRRYSLGVLEHGLLRRKALVGGPGASGHGEPPPPLVVDALEPRMHFALNCGAQSCPPVRAYTGQGLEGQLAAATADFIDATLEVGGDTAKAAAAPQGDAADMGAGDGNFVMSSLANTPPGTAMAGGGGGGGGAGSSSSVISLSRLFRWFRRDMIGGGSDADLLAWVGAHAGPAARGRLAAAGPALRVVYQKYNWQDNGDWAAKPDVRYMRVYDLSFRRSA